MRTSLSILLASSGLLSCAPSSQPPPVTAPVAPSAQSSSSNQGAGSTPGEVIAADSTRMTAAGLKYVAPAGWTLRARDKLVILSAQEGDAHLAIFDSAEQEPDRAVAEGWRAYSAKPTPPLRLALDRPARQGWDQIRQYMYELPPNEKRVVVADARRHGSQWAVLLVDAAIATLDKRGAQFGLLSESIRPNAYTRESFAGKQANPLDAGRLARLDELVELGRQQLGIPGVAVAIVQDGKLLHARGFGVRELGRPETVDADSLFMVASTTKALTTLLLAELVDSGQLRWDQPVTEVYPAFRMGSAEATAATRIEHLVCACTGLPRKDMEWLFEFAGATPLTEMGYLAKVEPTTGFGETFQYSNLLAAAAGYTAAHVLAPKEELGKAYDAAMQRKVFDPLGMKSTTFDFARALRANHALPHSWDLEARPQRAPMDMNYAAYPLRPAGGAWSSVRDMIKYVQLELAHGVTPDGQRVVSEANLLKRRQKYVAVGESGYYGMGLIVDTTYGTQLVEHNGGLIGYTSKMFWLPEYGVGAVILTNASIGGALLGPFRRALLEQLFDARPEAAGDLQASAAAARQRVASDRARLSVPAESAAAAALAKRYFNTDLGAVVVSTDAKGTHFDMGEWKSVVATRKNDDGSISFVTITPGQSGFEFVVAKPEGAKRRLVLRDAQHEYVFTETVQ